MTHRVETVAIFGSDLYAGTYADGLFHSTNNGKTFDSAASGIQGLNLECFAEFHGVIYLGTGKGVFRSTDNGASWNIMHLKTQDSGIYTFLAASTGIWAGSHIGEIFFLGGPDSVWRKLGSIATYVIYPSPFAVTSLIRLDTILIVGSAGNGIFRSTDNGATWNGIDIGLADSAINALIQVGDLLFAGTNKGLYVSADSGSSWNIVTTITPSPIWALYSFNGVIVASVLNKDIAVSSDSGLSWKSISQGFPLPSAIGHFVANDSYLFAGTLGIGLWRCPITTIMKASVNNSDASAYSIPNIQNYPNPVQQSTTFTFALLQSGYVNLAIYSLSGERVATLVSQTMEEGAHTVRWETNDLEAGVYVCRLESETSIETRKILLLK